MIQVKCFEESHESDLEVVLNEFLNELDESQFIDIKYASSHFLFEDEQIFSFSACVLYCMKTEKLDKLSSRRKFK